MIKMIAFIVIAFALLSCGSGVYATRSSQRVEAQVFSPGYNGYYCQPRGSEIYRRYVQDARAKGNLPRH